MRLRTRLLGTVTLAFLSGACAQAQTPDTPYPYLGVGIGQSRASLDAQRLSTAALVGSGLGITSTSRDERDTAYQFFGGYQFNRYLGIEAGYFRLGKFGYHATTSPAGQLNASLKVQGLSLDLVGSLPLSESLSVIGRAGYQRARTNANWMGSGSASSLTVSSPSNDSDPRYGIGLQYAFSPRLYLRAEAERSRFADALGSTARAAVYSLSLVMPLGRTSAPVRHTSYVPPSEAPRPIAEPAMTAAPPLPVAVVPAPPARVPLRKVSFTAESLFGFDSAELRPPGKAALNKFADELIGTKFDSIAVTGHTDRLGSTAYNQTLSLKRADAVKAYLVSVAGLDATLISAEGRSESQPVTQPGDCKGPKSARLIACLQPDRRVDIQVSGTR